MLPSADIPHGDSRLGASSFLSKIQAVLCFQSSHNTSGNATFPRNVVGCHFIRHHAIGVDPFNYPYVKGSQKVSATGHSPRTVFSSLYLVDAHSLQSSLMGHPLLARRSAVVACLLNFLMIKWGVVGGRKTFIVRSENGRRGKGKGNRPEDNDREKSRSSPHL